MVKFEEVLRTGMWPEWQEHYINYHLLKDKLEGIIDAQQAKQDEIVIARKHLFQGALDESLSEVRPALATLSGLLCVEQRVSCERSLRAFGMD